MDFDQAINAHVEWKRKLRTYIEKPDGSLKIADIEPDNKCTLGQWIYGEGTKFKNATEYASLKSEHAKFHKAAAEIVKKADSGKNVTEDVAFGSKSDFGIASALVVLAIAAIKRKAT